MSIRKIFAIVFLAMVMAVSGVVLVGCDWGRFFSCSQHSEQEENETILNQDPNYNLNVLNVAGENIAIKMNIDTLEADEIFNQTSNGIIKYNYDALNIDTTGKNISNVGTKAIILTIENNSQKALGAYFWNQEDTALLHSGVQTAPTEATIAMSNGIEKSDILYGHHNFGQDEEYDIEYEFYNQIPAGATETMHIFIRLNSIKSNFMLLDLPINLIIEEYVPTTLESLSNIDIEDETTPYVLFVKADATEHKPLLDKMGTIDMRLRQMLENGELTDLIRVINDDFPFGECSNTVYLGDDNIIDISCVTHLVLPYDYEYVPNIKDIQISEDYDLSEKRGSGKLCGQFMSGFNSLKALSLPDSISGLVSIQSSSLESIVLPEYLDKISFGSIDGAMNSYGMSMVDYMLNQEEDPYRYFTDADIMLSCPNLKSLLLPDSIQAVIDFTGYGWEDCGYHNPEAEVEELEWEYKYLLGKVATIHNGIMYLGGVNNPYFAAVLAVEAEYTSDEKYEIIIQEGCHIIGEWAFEYYEADLNYGFIGVGIEINIVTIPNSVEYILDNAFSSELLESVLLSADSHLISIGIGAFSYSHISSFTIPETVKKICSWAFCYTPLVSITIPANIDYLGLNAFEGCDNLEEVVFSQGIKLTCLSSGTFRYCSSLESIIIPDGITIIGNGAFYSSGIKSIEVPSSIEIIKPFAFCYCGSLESVGFGANSHLSIIDEYAFYNCTALSSFTMPNSVTKIGSGTFYNCTALSSITLSNSLVEIDGIYAFAYCPITTITIPASVVYIGSDAFKNTNLSSAIFEDTNHWFASDGELLLPHFISFEDMSNPSTAATYLKTGYNGGCFGKYHIVNDDFWVSHNNVLLKYAGSASEVVIPIGILKLAENVFSNDSSVTSVTIPQSVIYICFSAFTARNLSSIIFEDTNGWYKSNNSGTWDELDVSNPLTNVSNLKNSDKSCKKINH